MIRLAAALLLVVTALAPAATALAQDVRADLRPDGSSRDPGAGHRPSPGPRPPGMRRPIFPCCVGYGFSYYPSEPPPPIIVPAQPPAIYVVPSPPALAYVPTPRPEPTPEIAAPGGRWVRHGNGREYPYSWVFEPTSSW